MHTHKKASTQTQTQCTHVPQAVAAGEELVLEAEGFLDDAAELGVVHRVGLALEALRPDALPQPREEPAFLLWVGWGANGVRTL